MRQVNVVGLERAEFGAAEIETLQDAFRLIYRSGAPQRHSIDQLRADPRSSPLVLDRTVPSSRNRRSRSRIVAR